MRDKKSIICHVTVVHPYNDNRIFYKECLSLKKEGYKVFLIASDTESKVQDGISIYGIKRYKNRVVNFIRTSVFGVFFKAKKLNADIYHFHDPELMIFGILMRIIGKKVIYDIHENNSASILSKPYIKKMWKKKVLSFVFNLIEFSLVRFYNKLVVASPAIYDKFEKYNPTLINNFPIVTEPPKLKSLLKKKKNAIIYVGGLSKIRGIIELINAFSEIDNIELWLLGPFESESFKEECINTLGWKKVKYLGVVEPYKVFSYIQEADAGVICFLDVPNHITLPTKPFEYMICKKPMIMSDFEYWKNFFKDGAVFVNPSDSKSIKNGILDLFNSTKRMEKMGNINYHRIINEYNWQKEAEKLILLYKEL